VEKIFNCLINAQFYKIKLNFISLEQLKLKDEFEAFKNFEAFNFILVCLDKGNIYVLFFILVGVVFFFNLIISYLIFYFVN
jgi:hypothetical protein